MKLLGIVAIEAGVVILLYSIVQYYRSLLSLKKKSYSKKLFSRWSYVLCMALMFFFLAGYIITIIFFASLPEFRTSNLLIASIYFFGAIFVFIVTKVQAQMSHTISGKTDEMILTLVNAMEAKDNYTRGHSEHVSNLAFLFYTHLPENIKKTVNLTYLKDAAVLHDVGKIGISDSVLNKPGKLTMDERLLIEQHPLLGKHILDHTSFNELGNIILTHHERVDEQGYYKIPANQIPIEAKIIAIADTFSALYSDRVYRLRLPYEEAVAVLKEEAGTHLDSQLVDIFLSISKKEIDLAGQSIFKHEE